MAGVLNEEDDIFNSHDVVFLAVNTPIDEALELKCCRLKKYSKLRKQNIITCFGHYELLVSDITKTEFLKFVLTTTCFSFSGNKYQHMCDTAVGSAIPPIVANLYMEFLEKLLLIQHWPHVYFCCGNSMRMIVWNPLRKYI